MTRQTAPRPLAWQNYNWEVACAVTQAMDQDDPNLEYGFPLVLDQIAATLGTTKCPLVITDPQTGVQTQVVAIGEKFDLAYNSVETTGTVGEGLFVYAADFTVTVEERVNFNVDTYYNPSNQPGSSLTLKGAALAARARAKKLAEPGRVGAL